MFWFIVLYLNYHNNITMEFYAKTFSGSVKSIRIGVLISSKSIALALVIALGPTGQLGNPWIKDIVTAGSAAAIIGTATIAAGSIPSMIWWAAGLDKSREIERETSAHERHHSIRMAEKARIENERKDREAEAQKTARRKRAELEEQVNIQRARHQQPVRPINDVPSTTSTSPVTKSEIYLVQYFAPISVPGNATFQANVALKAVDQRRQGRLERS